MYTDMSMYFDAHVHILSFCWSTYFSLTCSLFLLLNNSWGEIAGWRPFVSMGVGVCMFFCERSEHLGCLDSGLSLKVRGWTGFTCLGQDLDLVRVGCRFQL